MQLIDPKYMTLAQLLSGRLFRIPNYQRAYSWKAKQRTDMFNDIRALRDDGRDLHFMATVVGLVTDRKTIVTDDFDIVDVVDGQQRLTTLTILLKAIEKQLSSEDEIHGRLKAELGNLLVKEDQLSLLLLQTNHDNQQFFTQYMRKGTVPKVSEAETLADRLLVQAIHECEEFVASWGDPVELTATLKNKLTFILHLLAEEGTVYTVFEVLNSRGIPVAWLDRLKSFLMAIAFENDQGNRDEVISELHAIWEELYRVVGLRQGMSTEALRFAATLGADTRRSKVLSEEDAVDTIRTAAGDSPEAAIDLSQWLLTVTKAVDDFLVNSPRSKAATRIAHARLVAVSVKLLNIPEAEEEEILAEWERVSYKIFGLCRKDARSKVGDYVRLAWDINEGNKNTDEILSALARIGSEEEEREVDWAEHYLLDANCYEGWEGELRYLLFRYEEYLARQQGSKITSEQWARIWEESPSRSIEHVFPQSKGADRAIDDGVFVHRLGNLILLPPGLNSSLQDADPEAKASHYRATGLLLAQEVADVIEDEGSWGTEQIKAREEKLISWIRNHWA